jgi:hypothetical protein
VNENHRDPEQRARAPLDDDAIERLLGDAGRRPPIPHEDLDSIAGAARAAWQARERERQSHGESADVTVAPRRAPAPRPRRSRALAALALAAALAALLFGTRVWWRGGEAATPVVTTTAPARVAVVEASTTSLRIEEAGAERALAVGEAISAGTIVRRTSSAERANGAQPARAAALRLESGAVVRFDAGTSARLVSPTRIDLLAGALYADTGPDPTGVAPARRAPAAGLEIHTEAGVARDVGTRFIAGLVAGSDAPTLRVLVRDGKVRVERDSDSALANAGEQITARAGAEIELGPAPSFGPEWAWVIDAAPPFEVAGRSIAEILDWVERETGWAVRYEDAALAEAARGMIQQASREQIGAMRPDLAPFVLLPGANLEGEVEAGVLTVRRLRAGR